jgi:hypothetical protein
MTCPIYVTVNLPEIELDVEVSNVSVLNMEAFHEWLDREYPGWESVVVSIASGSLERVGGSR